MTAQIIVFPQSGENVFICANKIDAQKKYREQLGLEAASLVEVDGLYALRIWTNDVMSICVRNMSKEYGG